MKDRVRRISLLLTAAAMISVSLPSCSKSGDKEQVAPAPHTEQTETEAPAEEVPEEEPEVTTTAAEKEKKSEETTAKKKKKKKTTTASSKTDKDKKKTKTTTTTAEPEEELEPANPDPAAIENYVERKTGFFSDRAADLLGLDKDAVIETVVFDEDYLIMNEADAGGVEKWDYAMDGDERHSFTLEFTDEKLTSFSCSSVFQDFDTALSFVKTKGWERDDSQTAKGKRVFRVEGKNAEYTIYKTRDDDAGSAFITQSYSLKE